ncbi:hypothetical protein EWE75_23270 [Sphingomonas populi]|uniref:Uncharacterized protein n=1 Tax=Sphingomonas populi TaxID=2484750 RepID=A0A4Q6XR36_9SPHN|nr:hypothetical protein EWE75_23270 [Sphingomonas populi]
MDVGHLLLLLQRNIAPVWHHTMPGEGYIHPISSIGRLHRAMWVAQGEADIRTVAATARPTPGTNTFATIAATRGA